MTTGILTVTLLFVAYAIHAQRANAHPQTRHSAAPRVRPVEQRIAWLQERVKTHRFGCRHAQVMRRTFHCRALVWTKRELRQARREWEWSWRLWLPDKWARLGACETGYGRRPGNWRWDSGTHVSAFGITRANYAADARAAHMPQWDRHPSPWQQYRTALAHYRLHGGFSGWGCRSA